MREDKTDALGQIRGLRVSWQRLHRSWWAVHYGLGMTGAVASAAAGLVSALSTAEHWTTTIYVVILSGIAAITTSLITLLGAVHKADKYRLAFHIVDQGLLQYKARLISVQQLCNVTQSAREIVLSISADVSEQSPSKKSKRGRVGLKGLALEI